MKLTNYDKTIKEYLALVTHYLRMYHEIKSYDEGLKSLFVTDSVKDNEDKLPIIPPVNKVIMVLMIEYFYIRKDRYSEISKTRPGIAQALVYHLKDIDKKVDDFKSHEMKISGLVDESEYSEILMEDSNFTEKDRLIFGETLQIFQDYLEEYLEVNRNKDKKNDTLNVSNLLQRKEKLLSKVINLRDKDTLDRLSNVELLERYLDNHILIQLKNEEMTEQDKMILCIYLCKIVRAFETSPKNNWKYMLKNCTTYSREGLEQKLERIEDDVKLYKELFESDFYSQLLKNWMDNCESKIS